MNILKPIRQDLKYHCFAYDCQTKFGIPHFWNVITNLAFVLAGIYGLMFNGQSTSYYVIMVGTILVGFGSGYYHWNPNNQTLVWDRIPMTIVFMALVTSLINEWWLWPLVIAGILSVVYWHYTDDLRPYVFVQFGSVMFLLAVGGKQLWPVVAMYVVAKFLEAFDQSISPIGGHPWKHVAAAIALYFYIGLTVHGRLW